MKAFRIIDQYYDAEEPAFFLIDGKDERNFRDAAAYCTFVADIVGTGLKPSQIGHLLERFYGFAAAPRQPAEALDMTEERRRYHVRGKPLPMKAALMNNKALYRGSMTAEIERYAIENEQN